MGLLELYHRCNTELADVRTNHWVLISSPWIITVLSIAYLYYILSYGPKYMRNRTPYKLHTFIRFYNIFQIVTNGMIVYHILENGWYEESFFYCVPVDYSTSPRALKFTRLAWYILVLKIIDYIETIMFVLRKKQRQISFLHVYHHVSTVFLSWVFVKYYSMSMSLTVALVNCGIHVIMYSYYLLSSYGPYMQKLLNPVKPMITIAQMVQFVILIAHSLQAFIPGCPGIELVAGLTATDLIINFVLFYNFYRKNYVKKEKQK